MTITHALAAILLAVLLWRAWKWTRDTAYVMAALNHVRCQSDVEEGFIAGMGNLGVLYSSKVVVRLDKIIVVHVHAAYKRGGYPEHERFYLVQVHRSKKMILQLDAIDVADAN